MVMAESSIQPGERLSVVMRLSSQVLRMRIQVATVRWERDRVYGLEFVALSPVAERRLKMFVAGLSKKIPTRPVTEPRCVRSFCAGLVPRHELLPDTPRHLREIVTRFLVRKAGAKISRIGRLVAGC
ncbi:MAG: hypothetical protein U0231_17175 [Nitrospiraceae bacterium]